MDNFFAINIQRAGLQVLETVYILATSKKIETIKSRYSFLLTTIDTLKQGQSNPEYSTYTNMAVDIYKTTYYDRELQEYQLAILSNPNGFDLNNFYCNSLVNAIKKICAEQMEEIKALKKETAKVKRVAKVKDTIKLTQTELQTKCLSASSFSTAIAELERLITTFTP